MTTENCRICNIAQGKEEVYVIYQDETTVAFLSEQPAVPGHIIVAPKNHFTIIEQVPESLLNQCAKVANKISTCTFEALHAQGTNVLIHNGIPAGQEHAHFLMHILPRRQADSLNFQWQLKQMSEEELSTIELRIKEQTKNISGTHHHEEHHKEEHKSESIEKRDDLRVKYFLRRVG